MWRALRSNTLNSDSIIERSLEGERGRKRRSNSTWIRVKAHVRRDGFYDYIFGEILEEGGEGRSACTGSWFPHEWWAQAGWNEKGLGIGKGTWRKLGWEGVIRMVRKRWRGVAPYFYTVWPLLCIIPHLARSSSEMPRTRYADLLCPLWKPEPTERFVVSTNDGRRVHPSSLLPPPPFFLLLRDSLPKVEARTISATVENWGVELDFFDARAFHEAW